MDDNLQNSQKIRHRWEDFASPELNMRLMLIGRTGSGKSSVGNSILGKELFPVGKGVFKSTTLNCQAETVTRRKKRIKVLDTCGMFDTKRPYDQIHEEIRKSHQLLAPGPHAFLLVVPIEPYTEDHHRSVELLEAIFPDMYDFTILVFSKADRLQAGDGSEMSVEDAVLESDDLRDLCDKVSWRYVTINNKEQDRHKLHQSIHELLDKVYDLYEFNEQEYYRSDMSERGSPSSPPLSPHSGAGGAGPSWGAGSGYAGPNFKQLGSALSRRMSNMGSEYLDWYSTRIKSAADLPEKQDEEHSD